MACHVTPEERDRIAQFRQQRWLPSEIARELGRSPSTITRELTRNSTGSEYLAAQAHESAKRRRRERPLVRKVDRPELNARVRHGLAHCHSPDEIAGRLKLDFPDERRWHVSPQTIYTWIRRQDKPLRKHWESFLRKRGRRSRKRPTNPEETAARASITGRPAIIERRQRRGDFEGDTVLGPPGTGGVVTLVDRKSRFTIMTKIKHKRARHVHHKIKRRLQQLKPDHRRSLTFDNGTEFARCPLLENHMGVQIYFAEPGRPYQRGTNENTNGLIRQFFPKGTDFRFVSHWEVQQAENLLNNRPRACLGYRTPAEVFFEKSARDVCD